MDDKSLTFGGGMMLPSIAPSPFVISTKDLDEIETKGITRGYDKKGRRYCMRDGRRFKCGQVYTRYTKKRRKKPHIHGKTTGKKPDFDATRRPHAEEDTYPRVPPPEEAENVEIGFDNSDERIAVASGEGWEEISKWIDSQDDLEELADFSKGIVSDNPTNIAGELFEAVERVGADSDIGLVLNYILQIVADNTEATEVSLTGGLLEPATEEPMEPENPQIPESPAAKSVGEYHTKTQDHPEKYKPKIQPKTQTPSSPQEPMSAPPAPPKNKPTQQGRAPVPTKSGQVSTQNSKPPSEAPSPSQKKPPTAPKPPKIPPREYPENNPERDSSGSEYRDSQDSSERSDVAPPDSFHRQEPSQEEQSGKEESPEPSHGLRFASSDMPQSDEDSDDLDLDLYADIDDEAEEMEKEPNTEEYAKRIKDAIDRGDYQAAEIARQDAALDLDNINHLRAALGDMLGEIPTDISLREYLRQQFQKKEETAKENTLSTPKLGSKQRESALSNLPVVRIKNLGGGANDSRIMELEDGSKGVFKIGAGEYPGLRRNVEGGTQYKREVAAYRVASILGFDDLVPPTVLRNTDHGEGSLQDFVDGAKMAMQMDVGQFDGEKDSVRAAIFDYLIGNTDRHSGNWLVKDQKIVLIDHGLSFPHSDNNEFYSQIFRYVSDKRFKFPDMSHIQGKWDAVEEALGGLIEDRAIALLKKRFNEVASGEYDVIY